jgi:hypothetical protein
MCLEEILPVTAGVGHATMCLEEILPVTAEDGHATRISSLSSLFKVAQASSPVTSVNKSNKKNLSDINPAPVAGNVLPGKKFTANRIIHYVRSGSVEFVHSSNNPVIILV